MAQKPAQYNIGDRVMLVGTIIETPNAGSIVGLDSFYEIAIPSEGHQEFAMNLKVKKRYISPCSEESFDKKLAGKIFIDDSTPSFPFSDKISEINIKYK